MAKARRQYIVVTVWRGVPTDVEAFTNLRAATKRRNAIRKTIDEQDDVCAVFEAGMPVRNQ